MKRRRPTSIRAMRGLLLLVMLSVVGGLVSIFVFGRSGRPGPTEMAARERDSGDPQFTVESADFRQAVTRDGQVVFEIAGDSVQRDREGNVFLRGVTLHTEREQGTFVLRGERATFHEESQEARLEGNVEVEGPGGLRLWSEWLELGDGGKTLVSADGARFAYGDQLVGKAGTFHLDFERELATLGKGVEIETVEGIVPRAFLHARRVELRQLERLVQAADGVVLGRGGDRLESKRLSLYLDLSGKRVERAVALWKVRGTVDPAWTALVDPESAAPTAVVGQDPATASALAEASQGTAAEPETTGDGDSAVATAQAIHFSARKLAALLDSSGAPSLVELNGYVQLPARIDWSDSAEGQRTLRAVTITGNLVDRQVTTASAFRKVELVERISAQGESEPRLRKLRSERADASLDTNGELVRLHAEGDVWLQDGEVEARGAIVNLHPPTQRLDLTGDPGADAEITTARGKLTAPEISYSEATGLLRAVPRVRTTLTDAAAGALSGQVLKGGGNEPVQVVSDEALLRQDSGEYVFLGNVRAWQGKNLLVCDQLRGSDQGQLAASGGVRTLWFPQQRGKAEEPSDAGQEEELPGVAIEADLMTYDDSLREAALRYEGSVAVRQQGLLVDCDDLVVDLDAEGEATTMHCVGNVVLRDEVRQAIVRGDRAVYSIVDEVVDVFGDPLTAEEPKRKLSGYELRYRVADGTMTMGGAREPEAPAPAEPPGRFENTEAPEEDGGKQTRPSVVDIPWQPEPTVP